MKIIGVFGILAFALAFGCNNKPAKETTKTVNETKIEVKTEKEADTQIKISSDGGSVKTKKLEVEIKKD